MRLLRSSILLFLLGGCATAHQNQATATGAPNDSEATARAEGDRLTCRKERVIGSNRRQRVCRYDSDRKRGTFVQFTVTHDGESAAVVSFSNCH